MPKAPLFNFAAGVYPKESRIARAKASAVGGKRKRCTKGKNCSAACIAANMVCLVDLPWTGPALTKAAKVVQNRKAGGGSPAPAPSAGVPTSAASAPKPVKQTPSAGVKPQAKPVSKTLKPSPEQVKGYKVFGLKALEDTLKNLTGKGANRTPEDEQILATVKQAVAELKREAKATAAPATGGLKAPKAKGLSQPLPVGAPLEAGKARGFDKNFAGQSIRKEGDLSYNKWGDSYGPGTKKLGQGTFGTVLLHPDGTVVKRGIISDVEAAAIKKAGEAGVGPKLISAEIGPKNGIKTSAPVKMHDGRIAMSKVEGQPAEKVAGQTFNGVTAADAFWKARAALHKTGIAHNDMHSDNVLVDKNGKGMIVDLGFAQISPKAALSEALGAFKAPSTGTAIPGIGKQKGDWQVRQWVGSAGFRLQDAENQGLNSKAGAKLLKEAPYLHRIYSQNLPKVFAEMKKMGYNDDEIKTVAITGIKNKLDAYEKGPWSKMSDADALKLTNILYEGT
jgi:hypothetical protein